MLEKRSASDMVDTGIEYIGTIPKSWNVRKLGQIAKKITDYVASGSFASLAENVQYMDEPDYAQLIRTVDLSGAINKKPVYVTKSAYEFLSNSNLFGGELILPNIGSVGSVYQYEKMYEHATLAPNSILVDMDENNRFYYYWFSNPTVSESLRLLGNSTVQIKFNKTQIRQYLVPQPPVEEQEAIARYLDSCCSKLDEIINEAKSSIIEYKELKIAAVNDAVTKGIQKKAEKESHVDWIGKIPSDWRVIATKRLFRIKKDIAGEEGHTVLSITQKGIVPKDFGGKGQYAADYSNYQLVNKGDFAMNHMDLLTGWLDISSYDGVTSPDYRVFVPTGKEQIFPPYYKYVMQNCYSCRIYYGLGHGVAGMGRWRLPADMFLDFKLPLPPVEEQRIIAEYLDKKTVEIDLLIKEKEELIEDLENYKKSLILEIVTGKRKVV